MKQLAVRLGLFAVLFQAILFGWHHHELNFPGRLAAPILENPATAPQIADNEDGCEICQVLHHLTAGTVDFAAAPTPSEIATALAVVETASAARARILAFRARAPPLA